jgi:hypothetical protein
MVVHIAKEHPLREVLIHEGGIGFRLFDHPALVQRSSILCQQHVRRNHERNSNEGILQNTDFGFLFVTTLTGWAMCVR